MTETRYRLGIDVGGTFTDFVLSSIDGSTVAFHKEASRPEDPSLAAQRGAAALIARENLPPGAIELVVHGTTLALNAIIQKRGAAVALVVSRGNRDVMEIARARMPNSYDFTAGREAPLIPREAVFEISARGLSDGSVLTEVDPAEIETTAAAIKAGGFDAVAVMLLNSYRDGDLERRAAAALTAALGDVPVTPSSDIWPEMREYERALAACMNAYVQPMMSAYFDRLAERFAELGIAAPIYITANTGGTVSLPTARARPVDTILSGPASGVLAATRVARDHPEIVTFDMGGTSTDIAVSQSGALEFSHWTMIGDYPLMLPVVNVSAIGAGGGSIVWTDAQGVLKVGPESAGADPGPICYGRGGDRVTITDCYLALGYLRADGFLGGRMTLDVDAAKAGLAQIQARMGLPAPEDAAAAAIDVATAKMATELRKLMAQKGLDPRRFGLTAFGGAGPTHANILAEEARFDAVLAPRLPGTFCALGAILADVRRDFVRPARLMIDRNGANWPTIDALLADVEAEALDWISQEGDLIGAFDLQLTADMRYPAQAFEIGVAAQGYAREDLTAERLIDLYNAEHERLYGFQEPDSEVQITNLRLAVVGRVPPIAPQEIGAAPAPAPVGGRRAYWRGWRDFAVYERQSIGAGATLEGPAIVEQPDTTVVILPGWRAAADQLGNLLIRRAEPIGDPA